MDNCLLKDEVVILDWQFVVKSLGAIDVARLIGGSMTPEEAMACEPGRAVPVMQIHGTLDGVVPYDGSNFNLSMD